MPEGPFIRRFQQEEGTIPPEVAFGFGEDVSSIYPGNVDVPRYAPKESQKQIAKFFKARSPQSSDEQDKVYRFHSPRMRNQLDAAIQSYNTPDDTLGPRIRQNSFAQYVRRNPTGIRFVKGAEDHSGPSAVATTAAEKPTLPGMSIHDIANHEAEHARNPLSRTETFVGDSDPAAEIPAVLGDLVFRGRAASKAIGNEDYTAEGVPGFEATPATPERPYGHNILTRPKLQHEVLFPSGYRQDVNQMAKMADEHGYFDGRTMTELLATQVGQQYLKHILDKPPFDYDRDVRPKLAEKRADDRFERTMRKIKQQQLRDESLLDRMIGSQ